MLGMMLCLLAALFAIEAKLACYVPDSNHAIQISASKLKAADAPGLVAEAFALSQAPLFLAGCLLIFAFALRDQLEEPAWLVFVSPAPRHRSAFVPHLFFRPPPVL